MKKLQHFFLFNFLFLSLLAGAQTNILQQKVFGGDEYDRLSDIIPTPDGGYLLSSITTSGISGNKTIANNGISDGWIIKLNASFDIEWQKLFGGTNGNTISDITIDSDGNIYCWGTSNSTASGNKEAVSYGNNDAWLIKLNAQGNKIWDKTYGGIISDNGVCMLLLNNNKLLLGAISNSGISGNKTVISYGANDYWVICTDSSGTINWQQSYGSDEFDDLHNMAINQSGDIILSGESSGDSTGIKNSPHFGMGDIWLVSIDTTGNLNWEKSFGGDDIEVKSGIISKGNNFIIGCYTWSGISGNKSSAKKSSDFWNDLWIFEINSAGTKLKDSTLGGLRGEIFDDIYLNNDIFISSHSTSGLGLDKSMSSYGEDDIWILRLDNNFDIKRQYAIGGDDWDISSKICFNSNGNLVVACDSYSGISGNKTLSSWGNIDIWLAEIEGSVGIPEKTIAHQIQIYPNPTSGNIQLLLPSEYLNENIEISLFNLQARLIHQQQIKPQATQQPVNFRQLPTGTYFLQIKSPASQSTHKLIIH